VPDIVNLTLTEDDDGSATFQITSGGTALNLTSADVIAVVKASQQVEDDASSGVYTLTEGDGVTIVSATTGTVKLDFPAAVTESPSVWFYKVRVEASGETLTAIWGWISVQDA
jgi:hypothetical protein